MTQLSININKKTYASGVTTIDDLQFNVQQGEFVAIVGPSGTGKTTLLNIVAGIDKGAEGTVSFNGGSPDLARLGFMFQEARLMPWLTVEENIKLVVPEGAEEALSRINQLLARVSLDGFKASFPGQLSGGMKRRAALVRAFINHPQLLLMDEPFQSLDKPTANSLRQLLLELWEETKPSVLFVTHSLREALTLADRIVFLSGRPSSVIMDYVVDLPRPRDIEDAAVNVLHAELLKEYPSLLSGSVETGVSANEEKSIG